MAVKIIDDLTGAELDEGDYAKMSVTVDGKRIRIDTTKEISSAIFKLAELTKAGWDITSTGPRAAGAGKSTEDRHGLDHAKVREWAIKSKLKNGKDKDKEITATTPRLSQHIWDAAKESGEDLS